jgi:excisionase family DNA binding protein
MRQPRRKVTDLAPDLGMVGPPLVPGPEAPRERKRLTLVPANPRQSVDDRMASAIPGHVETIVYLTPEQVASMLQVSVKTVYRIVATDASLPATRFGRAVRFRADLLERWLAAHTQRSRRQTSDQRSGVTTTDTSTAA